ncbi:hypothetical protein CMUS01_04887 [Colletotrichum musicola]|uniref:Uncharacterized protein n=1 Tax=Colletotrichum musicola TaxID=2175873 RepID=A0A8H6KUB9_9PEZI|nr:hypothetical protein CMUS01_04887 [Colletotrichum musicola]
MCLLEFRRYVAWDEPRGYGRGWPQGPDDSSKAAWGRQPPCSGVPLGVHAGGTAQEVGPFLSRGGGRSGGAAVPHRFTTWLAIN